MHSPLPTSKPEMIAFLAGDGLQAGEGDRIAFKVQAVDDDGNLSDSDDATPVDAEILFAPIAVAIAQQWQWPQEWTCVSMRTAS